jgi:predicted house-cleaning noncanonical NTP pyrophosphatase (MazG superfamily)
MNLKDFYTQEQVCDMFEVQSPHRYRKYGSIKKGNAYLYEREAMNELLRKRRPEEAEELMESYPAEELDLDEWLSLSEVMDIWPFSRQWLYDLRDQDDSPLETINIVDRIWFSCESIIDYIEESGNALSGEVSKE